MNGLPATPPLWQEARTAEGRVYYYNAHTKVTQWTKPMELMTAQEVRPQFNKIRCLYRRLTAYSGQLQTSHGENTLQAMGENIGTTLRQNKVYGRCQRHIRVR